MKRGLTLRDYIENNKVSLEFVYIFILNILDFIN